MKPTAENIARRFDALLRQAITPDAYATVLERNRTEPNPNVCHSHDFTDANATMDEAFAFHGISLFDINGQMSDARVALWNSAWEAWRTMTKPKDGATGGRTCNCGAGVLHGFPHVPLGDCPDAPLPVAESTEPRICQRCGSGWGHNHAADVRPAGGKR